MVWSANLTTVEADLILEGDLVFVSRHRLKDPAEAGIPDKFKSNFHGPFRVEQVKLPNVTVSLPPRFRKRSVVVNVDQLKRFQPADGGPLWSDPERPPRVTEVRESVPQLNDSVLEARVATTGTTAVDLLPDEFVADRLLDHRESEGHLEYLVRWEGYDDHTWEPAENILGTRLVQE